MSHRLCMVIKVCILVILVPTIVSAQGLDSPVQVDVYPQGLDATWLLPAEEHLELVLPSSFDSNRIRYRVSEGAVVKRLETAYEAAGDWVPPALIDIEAEIGQVEQDISSLEVELSGVQQTISYLAQVAHYTELANPLEYFRNAQQLRTEMETQKIELMTAKGAAEQKLRELKTQLANRYGGNRDRVLKIMLTTNGVGYVELIAYSAHSSWEPFYRASLDSSESVVTLDKFVSVKQRTGIDFTGRISTHTGALSDDVSLPKQNPLVARIHEFYTANNLLGSEPMYMLSKSATEEAPIMRQIDGPVGVTFVGMGSIYSDNQDILLSIASEQIPVQVLSTLLPYQGEQAWVLAQSKSPVAPLLSGKAEFAVDGNLTGQTRLSYAGGDDLLTLAFGKAPAITAEREPIIYTERRTWLGRQIRRDGYTITATNGTEREAVIEVIDRIPVSGHERVTISADISPKPDEENEGILTWRINLQPGEVRIISVEYEIQYPDGMQLSIE